MALKAIPIGLVVTSFISAEAEDVVILWATIYRAWPQGSARSVEIIAWHDVGTTNVERRVRYVEMKSPRARGKVKSGYFKQDQSGKYHQLHLHNNRDGKCRQAIQSWSSMSGLVQKVSLKTGTYSSD